MRLFPSVVVFVAASSLLAACATAKPDRHEGPMGTLVGAVTLPAGANADAVCPNLSVAVLDPSGAPVGDPSVHASRGRCLYTVDYVHAGEPLTLRVQASAPTACSSGKLSASDVPATVQLQDLETRTLDLSLHCA